MDTFGDPIFTVRIQGSYNVFDAELDVSGVFQNIPPTVTHANVWLSSLIQALPADEDIAQRVFINNLIREPYLSASTLAYGTGAIVGSMSNKGQLHISPVTVRISSLQEGTWSVARQAYSASGAQPSGPFEITISFQLITGHAHDKTILIS
jgi:hypothetical protein